MVRELAVDRNRFLIRLSAILFLAELAHGMLLYGIIPELVAIRFPAGTYLLGFIPLTGLQFAGVCLLAYTVAELAFKWPAGHYVDHHGPDRPLRAGLVLSLLALPLVLLGENPHLLLIGAVLHGLGASPIWPAVISAWTRGRGAGERGEVMGQILTGWMAGLGLGVILGNVLAGLSGNMELAVNLAPIVLWAITIVTAIVGAGFGAGPAAPGTTVAPILTFQFPRVLAVMGIGLFLQNAAFGSLILTFRELAVEHLFPPISDLDRSSAIQFGMLLLVGGAPSVGLLGPMGRVSDRVGRRKSVIFSMLLVTPLVLAAPFVSCLPIGSWGRFWLMVPGLVVGGVAYAFLLPAWHALALGRIPEKQRGRCLAVLMSMEMLALATGHLIGPSLYTRVHFAAPFLLAGGVFGILAVVYLLGFILPHEATHDEEQGQV